MRVFTGSDKYVRFMPRMEEDAELADQISDYVNYIIAHDNNGYRIIDTWLRDALLFKLGVVKFYYDDTSTVEEAEYKSINEQELAVLLDNPDVEVISTEESVVTVDLPDEPTEQFVQGYNLKVRVSKKSGKVKIENVPPEEFIFNRRAKSLEDARFICHRTTMTVSDLVSMGYDEDEVREFAGTTQVS